MKWDPKVLVSQTYDTCEHMAEWVQEVEQLRLSLSDAISRHQELAGSLIKTWIDHLTLFEKALWEELYCGWDPLPNVLQFHPGRQIQVPGGVCSGGADGQSGGWTQIAFSAAECPTAMLVRLGPCATLGEWIKWDGDYGEYGPAPSFPLQTMLSEETWNLSVKVFKFDVGPTWEEDKCSLVAEIRSCAPDKFRLATLLNQLYLISVCPETSVPGGRLPPVEKSNG